MNKISKARASTPCHHDKQLSCSNCRLSSLCLPLSLELNELDQINDVILRDKPLHKGEYLYRNGLPFTSIFATRSGSVKTTYLGNYLGLTIETVSRTFSRLQKKNVISSDRRLIRILKFDQLKSIAAG